VTRPGRDGGTFHDPERARPVRIEYLADHPTLAPALAAWHHSEWRDLLPWWTADAALEELRTHRARRSLPTTLVALDGSVAAGSVSLLREDLPEWSHLGPWLASLYVVPAARGRGIGRMLVRRCLAEAAELGIPRLYLFTAGQEAYYLRLGWQLLETTVYSGRGAAILCRNTAS